MTKTLLAIIIAIMSPFVVADEKIKTLVFDRKIHMNVAPQPDMLARKIFIYFDGSQKMTKILQEKVRAKGFTVASSIEESDEQIQLAGVFVVSGAGKGEARGNLGELLESSVNLGASQSPDYNQGLDLVQIAGEVAFTGKLSITSMLLWISGKTGVAGRFNEMLTGDPRGFCWAESCDKYTNYVVLSVRGKDARWWLEESVQDKSVVLDVVIADTIENALKPLYEIGSGNVK